MIPDQEKSNKLLVNPVVFQKIQMKSNYNILQIIKEDEGKKMTKNAK